MNITILSIGNKTPPELQSLIDEYTKRLPHKICINWQYLKHGQGADTISKNQEAEKVLKIIKKQDYVILLDETGQQKGSEEFSKLLFKTNLSNIVFVIGGAYGVSDLVKNRANIVLSISKLVFPHKLVRLILAEQIYRAHCIAIHHPYHHS